LSGSFDNLTAGSASAPGRFSFNGLLRTARKTKATAQPGGEGTDWRVQGHAAAQSQRGCRHGVPGDARLHICSIPDNQRFPQSGDAPIPRLSSRAMQTCGMAQGNADKYQAYAEECMQLIKRMPSDARPTLLRIAEAWLELALSELKRDMHPDNLQSRSTDKMQ
jgi:hypothetical protein